MLLVRVHEVDLLSRPQAAFLDATVQDDAAVSVVLGVEQQRTRRSPGVPFRPGQFGDDRFEHLLDAQALLGRAADGVVGIEAQIVLDLLLDAIDVGRRQVDLVDHRDELEVVLQREVQVGDRLRFDALRRVDEQQRSLAGHQ